MAEAVRVREVGLRDGLQLVKAVLPTDRKVEFCHLARAAGITEVEVTSFVPPSVIPQFGDAMEVAARVREIDGLKPSALVPNLKGAERAVAAGMTRINFVLSASEAHNLANVRRSVSASLEEFARIMKFRETLPSAKLRIAGGIGTCFGCAISGEVAPDRVLRIVDDLLEMGADELIVADTVGYANPRKVHDIFRAVLVRAGTVPVIAHFHDTHGLGMANVAAALEIGVRAFDSAIGGLGGCPFAPNATGNINTEDCVYLLESMGYDTGIEFGPLMELRRSVEEWLPGERFAGAIARSGLPKTFARRSAHA